ncbi:MAG: hypothetical protein IJK31_02200 [Ruminococcus sp.]|nr:hypothetical protein [Ruminococcus sp.]
MKKLMSLSLAALFIMSCGAGCGKKDDSSSEKKEPSKFVGKWECEKMSWNGAETDSFLGTPVSVMLQAELTDDGKFIAHSAMEDSVDADNNGTWKELSENSIEVTGNIRGEERTLQLEYQDNKLVGDLNESGINAVVYLVKVDEFTEYDPDADTGFDLSGLDFSIDPTSDIDMEFKLDDIDFNFSESDFAS